MKKSERRTSVIAVAALIVVVVGFCISMISAAAQTSKQKKIAAEISSQIELQKEANQEIRDILESDDHNAYLERVAREDYHYAGAGEIIYCLPDAS